MPRFRFQLQALLDFRIRKEDELKRRLGELEKSCTQNRRRWRSWSGVVRKLQRYEELESSDVDLERQALPRLLQMALFSHRGPTAGDL